MTRSQQPRSPAGPGRAARRPRSLRAAASPAERVPSGATSASARVAPLGRVARRIRKPSSFGLTKRALVFFGVMGILALSYVNSLRIYLVQQHAIATAQQQIAERSLRAAELDQQLQRWNDPSYVKSQARTRLGWVMPGEVGYRVVGADGKVLSGESEVGGLATRGAHDLSERWFDRLAGSIDTADDPVPVRP